MSEMDDKEYEKLREKVMWRIILRWSWVLNFLFSGLIILLLVQDILRDPSNFIGAAIAILIFGSGIIVHGVLAFNLFNGIVDRAVERELARHQLGEKPKRRAVEVGEDGELVEPDMAYSEPQVQEQEQEQEQVLRRLK